MKFSSAAKAKNVQQSSQPFLNQSKKQQQLKQNSHISHLSKDRPRPNLQKKTHLAVGRQRKKKNEMIQCSPKPNTQIFEEQFNKNRVDDVEERDKRQDKYEQEFGLKSKNDTKQSTNLASRQESQQGLELSRQYRQYIQNLLDQDDCQLIKIDHKSVEENHHTYVPFYSGITYHSIIAQCLQRSSPLDLSINPYFIHQDERTTIMIRNIPNKYNQESLIEEIDCSHKQRYDFFYLPIDKKNDCNIGYAFINFRAVQFILSFYQQFQGRAWRRFNSKKICSLCYATLQGRQALVRHFKDSITIKSSRYKPLFFNYVC